VEVYPSEAGKASSEEVWARTARDRVRVSGGEALSDERVIVKEKRSVSGSYGAGDVRSERRAAAMTSSGATLPHMPPVG
jgi:hypothetical protein